MSFDTTSQSEFTSTGSDESEDVSFAELGLTEDYFSHPEGHFGLSTVEELEAAIENCKSMIQSAKENSERQKKLVKKLIELRMKFQEVKEGPDELEPKIKQVLGHQLRKRKSKSIKNYCDCCNGLIWGVLQLWYRCRQCGLNCHSKCINSIRRKCITQNPDNLTYILNISPEMGLSWQQFNCIECKNPISIVGSGREEARLCDYTGRYFCPHCHWDDDCVSPARVLHGWDFSLQKVARQSFQILKRLYRRPLLNLQELNPLLFNYVGELRDIRKLREDILTMKEYFMTCNNAMEQKQLLKLGHRQHFVDNSTMFSMEDLVSLKQGELLDEIAKIVGEFAQHIKLDCIRCQVKGFYCEICNDGEPLFAFDPGVSICAACKAVFHKDCFVMNECQRCERMEIRRKRKNTIDFDEDSPEPDEKIDESSDKSSDSTKTPGSSTKTSSTLDATTEITQDLGDTLFYPPIRNEDKGCVGLETENTIVSLKKISLQPHLSESGMLRSRLSLPVIKQGTVYSVSSPDKPNYKHDWDAAIEDDYQNCKGGQGASEFGKVTTGQKMPTKQKFSRSDMSKDEHNPTTRRPQRNDIDFSNLVKVRARSRNKSGKKSKEQTSKPVNIEDPYGNLYETRGSNFMKKVSSTKPAMDNNSVVDPFEKASQSKHQAEVDNSLSYNPQLDPFDTECRQGRKFLDELAGAATSKSRLSQYDSYDPNSVSFFQGTPESSDILQNPQFLADMFHSQNNDTRYRRIDRKAPVVKSSSRTPRQHSYDPTLDPFQSDQPSSGDYDNDKNPFG